MTSKTILIIDDDNMLRAGLARGLRNAQFNVISAESAEKGAEIISRITPDAIVLDRMMTGTDGLTFLQNIRAANNNVPVIMLTALSGPENSIDGLSAGANDYLAKPFQLRELILRINNITKDEKRKTKNEKFPDGLAFIDNEFFVNGQLLALSDGEKKLLSALTAPIGGTATATPMVAKRLRSKLNSVLSGIDIITVRGKGYKLVISDF